jgi:hypothetical protein
VTIWHPSWEIHGGQQICVAFGTGFFRLGHSDRREPFAYRAPLALRT